MARTNTTILREQNEQLSNENAALRAQLADSEAHVKRLQLVIAKRYAAKGRSEQHSTLWQKAVAYAKAHGCTVQSAMAQV